MATLNLSRRARLAAGAALFALLLLVAPSAERAEAQLGPATFYGWTDAGAEVKAYVDGVLCTSATADATGFWTMQVSFSDPCRPQDGDTVTFRLNGRLLAGTETWAPLAAPADVQAGVLPVLSTAAPTVTHLLLVGLNSLTYTGPSASAASVAAEIGPSLQTLLAYDAATQTWLTFLPSAPAQVNTLKSVDQGDALIVRARQAGQWTVDDEIEASGSGARSVSLFGGLNAVGFTGAPGTTVATLLAPVAGSVQSAARFNAQAQSWDTYLPGAPAQVNTLSTLDRLDVLYIRMKAAATLQVR